MNRRNLIKTGVLAGLATIIPLSADNIPTFKNKKVDMVYVLNIDSRGGSCSTVIKQSEFTKNTYQRFMNFCHGPRGQKLIYSNGKLKENLEIYIIHRNIYDNEEWHNAYLNRELLTWEEFESKFI